MEEDRRKNDAPIHSTGPVEAVGPVELKVENLPPSPIPIPVTEEKATQKTTQVITTKDGFQVASPTTTAEEDRATVGQRRVNLIWEAQQAAIATMVVVTTLYVSGRVTLQILENAATDQQQAMAVTGFMLLSNIVNLVIGFYFGRTNHQKVGGVQSGR